MLALKRPVLGPVFAVTYDGRAVRGKVGPCPLVLLRLLSLSKEIVPISRLLSSAALKNTLWVEGCVEPALSHEWEDLKSLPKGSQPCREGLFPSWAT